MAERAEAMRNNAYVPPLRPSSPARVDLSENPELWEAYLRGGGWQLGSFGYGSGKEHIVGTHWKFEYSRNWESIKPIYAGYAEPLTYYSESGSTPNRLTRLSPPVSIPAPAAPRGDNRRLGFGTAEVSTGTTTITSSLLTRASWIFLNPTSTLPVSSSSDNGTNSRSISTNISPTELNSNSPQTIRVAVLIAMPSPSSSHGLHVSIPLSSSASFSPSLSSKAQPMTSHPLQLSSSSSPTSRVTDDEEQLPPLPYLEMGVADVVVIGRFQ
jgi:hypothetical protein